jgi:hypothetical protein
LPAILAPQLRQALLRLSRNQKAKKLAQRALKGLAGFAKSLKLKYKDIEVGFDFQPEPGLADNGDLEHDLQALLEAAGMAVQKAGTAWYYSLTNCSTSTKTNWRHSSQLCTVPRKGVPRWSW